MPQHQGIVGEGEHVADQGCDIGTGPALLMGLGICIAWNLLLIFAQHGIGWLRR